MIATYENARIVGAALDGARDDALARFAADIAALGGDAELVDAYRAALACAGLPDDGTWVRFAQTLHRFITGTTTTTSDQRRAYASLGAILAENVDLLR